jgi:hypothetical protein
VRAIGGEKQAELSLAPIYRDRGSRGPPVRNRKRRRPYPFTGAAIALFVVVAGFWPTVLLDEPLASAGDPTASIPPPSAAPREGGAAPRSSDAAPAQLGNLATGLGALGREAEVAPLLAGAELDLKADRLVLPDVGRGRRGMKPRGGLSRRARLPRPAIGAACKVAQRAGFPQGA